MTADMPSSFRGGAAESKISFKKFAFNFTRSLFFKKILPGAKVSLKKIDDSKMPKEFIGFLSFLIKSKIDAYFKRRSRPTGK
jgi:hypothetical protein